MSLLIVESPNKVRTISQFLPRDFKVEASVGHICSIANTGLYNLGIDIKNDFNINFVIDDQKKEVVKKLKGLVDKSDVIYLATDPD